MCEIAERSVTLVNPINDVSTNDRNLTLSDFRSAHSYVLLGEPGMGKSTEFYVEAQRIGTTKPISAQQFINQGVEKFLRGPLFIDALDEARVGSGGLRSVIGKIIARIADLGNPKFRLSCRLLDWYRIGAQKALRLLSDYEESPIMKLNPLSHEDIRTIVSAHEVDPVRFAQQARENNMGLCINNPLLLTLVIKSDQWPSTPTKMFENACHELLKHSHGDCLSKRLPDQESILNAAGQLCTLLLIANKMGWSVESTENQDVPSLEDLNHENSELLHQALKSPLFQGIASSRSPIHRLVAEYLGARYLDQIIQNGMSVRRILAQFIGFDGVLFSDLQGLIAWLAAFNSQIRSTMIQWDPMALAFNGDVTKFSIIERRSLCANLGRSHELADAWSCVSALGVLTGTERLSLIWELTKSYERSEGINRLIYLLLQGIPEIYTMMEVSGGGIPKSQCEINQGHLLKIVSDPSWDDYVRCKALDVLDIILDGNSLRGTIFRGLLKDVTEGRCPDIKNDLRGALLKHMYPSELQPLEIWEYLISGEVTFRYDTYLEFWDQIVERSLESQIIELLDVLCDKASEVIPKLVKHRNQVIVLKLISQGLELFGDKVSVAHLHRWFRLVESDNSHFILIDSSDHHIDEEESSAIRQWLVKHEQIQRALIEYDLIVNESNLEFDMTAGIKFIGCQDSDEFRLWCLQRASDLWDSNRKVAERLAEWSYQDQKERGERLSHQRISLTSTGLNEWIQTRPKKSDKIKREHTRHEKTITINQTESFEILEKIRQQKTQIENGNGSPVLLHYLAQKYFDGLSIKESDPKRHLMSYLDHDLSLTKSVLQGFQHVLDREDIPSLGMIAQLHENNKMSYLMLPYLAALEEEKEDRLSPMSEDHRMAAVAFYLVADLPLHRIDSSNYYYVRYNHIPRWYLQALAQYPETVANVLVSIHNACVRAKIPPKQYLFDLAFDRHYAEVASRVVRRMFTVFPTRCAGNQLESLRLALWSAILSHSMPTEELKHLALKRLNRKNLDLGQRAQWLCVGLVVDRDHTLPLLKDFLLLGRDSRTQDVLRFMSTNESGMSIFEDINQWSSQELAQLIQVLGSRLSPPVNSEVGCWMGYQNYIRPQYRSLLDQWLQILAERIDHKSVELLTSLIKEPSLLIWKREIMSAHQQQRQKLRESMQSDPILRDLHDSLQGGAAASVADLAALTTDIIEELADQIRNHSTNDWRKYWNHISVNQHGEPKCDTECQDILLSDLRLRLQEKFNGSNQSDVMRVQEKGMDICVSHDATFVVPIKIRKNQSVDLWRDFYEKLAINYSGSLKSEGYGIYVVLWFGAKYMRIVAPQGGLPQVPHELKNALVENLDIDLIRRIHIVVIDVSMP